MNLKERLAQCQADKAAIEVKEKELLEQTKAERVEAERIPFARTALLSFPNKRGGVRLILHLTPEFVRTVNDYKGRVVAFGKGGYKCCISANQKQPTVRSMMSQYTDVRTLLK